jgi:hypothetical protein
LLQGAIYFRFASFIALKNSKSFLRGMPILRLVAMLGGKFIKQKFYRRSRDPNGAGLAIKTAATWGEGGSPTAALARFQLALSSCARCRSGLRAAPFSEQACGLAVLLQPFHELFALKASHMIAVVSSPERYPRVASSFSERAKFDQHCYRAPEPASDCFLSLLSFAYRVDGRLVHCLRAQFF